MGKDLQKRHQEVGMMLPEVEQSLRLLDSVWVGVCVVQADLQIVFWNRCLEAWTQIPRTQAEGMSIAAVLPPLVQPEFACEWQRLFAEGVAIDVATCEPLLLAIHPLTLQVTAVTAIPAADKHRFQAVVTIQTRPTALKPSLAAMGNSSFVEREGLSEQQIGQALRQSEERFRSLVSNIPGAVYRCANDAHWTIEYVSEAMQQICGYPATDFIHNRVRSFASIDHPDDVAMVKQVMQAGLCNRQPCMLEYRIIHADGSIRWVYDKCQGVYDNSGNLLWIDGILFDISERKQAQAEIVLAHARLLEQETRQRKELTLKNQALEHARLEEEAANRAKSNFLATMSHEIRTPMNAVIGLTELLLETPLTAQQLDFVQTIRTSGQALLGIINDILDFSKIESGKLELEEHPFDLRTCVEEAIDLLAPKAAEKQLELAYVIDPDVPGLVVGDSNCLRQILVNLISNAVKFTEAGEVTVSVVARWLQSECAASEAACAIRFEVRDTGVGIPSDRLDRLFHPFSQIDSSISRNYGGTGLGLVISQRLSEMMGGRIWVDSTLGVGSTFYCSLVARVKLDVPSPDISPMLAGKRLLVVEDNAVCQHSLVIQAEAWGMTVLAAASGQEALEHLEHHAAKHHVAFDVAVLDSQMSDMDGFTLAAAIEQRSQGQIPLVLLTSISRTEVNSRLHNSQPAVQFAQYLSKPVKRSQFYNALVGVFGQTLVSVSPPPVEPQASTVLKTSALKILVAEDNLVNQKVIVHLLKRLGYEADVVNNGLEALAALSHQAYDLVLMDIQMPEMDGLTATQHICQTWQLEHRPHLVAVTANATQGDYKECLEAGMDDYLSKPIQFDKLKQLLNQCQSRWQQGQSAAFVDGAADCIAAKDSAAKDSAAKDSAAKDSAAEAEQSAIAEAIDPQALRFLCEADHTGAELLQDLISSYLVESAALLQSLQDALSRTDVIALQRVCHMLKSCSAALGAIKLADRCASLETIDAHQAIAVSQAQLPLLLIDYQQTIVALQSIAENPPF
jgi:PAS domain S-box-containing protein